VTNVTKPAEAKRPPVLHRTAPGVLQLAHLFGNVNTEEYHALESLSTSPIVIILFVGGRLKTVTLGRLFLKAAHSVQFSKK
jgi:hypothetical protein